MARTRMARRVSVRDAAFERLPKDEKERLDAAWRARFWAGGPGMDPDPQPLPHPSSEAHALSYDEWTAKGGQVCRVDSPKVTKVILRRRPKAERPVELDAQDVTSDIVAQWQRQDRFQVR